MAKVKKKSRKSATQIERAGPYLAAALIANSVSVESDGVPTIVRIVDRVGLSPDSMNGVAKNTKINLPMTMVIALKTGGFKGPAVVLIIQRGPSGESAPIGNVPVEFDGTASNNVHVRLPLTLTWETEGEYWFDVFVAEKFYSSIPLYVKIGEV